MAKMWFWLHQRTFRAAQELIVLSDTMKQHLRDQYKDVLTPITIISNWADPNQIKPVLPSDNWFIKRHNLASSFTVLYAGNQGRCHDLDTLIDAAEQLRNHPRIRFLLVGSGYQNRFLKARVCEAGLTNVTFLPYQDADALPAMLAAADLAVVSLLAKAEGQVAPSKLYGHLAAGSPLAVICSERSYLRAEIDRAKCGRCFASGEHTALAEWIRQLAADPALCRQLGAAARSHLIAHASPEHAVQAYAEVLARHLPLSQKEYAPPLRANAIPLPRP
jgi:glycosyltransferase involved in cell wall biosynthesis